MVAAGFSLQDEITEKEKGNDKVSDSSGSSKYEVNEKLFLFYEIPIPRFNIDRTIFMKQ